MRNLKSQSIVDPSSEEVKTKAVEVLTAILADAKDDTRLLYGKADFTRDIATLKRRTRAEGLTFVTKGLPSLLNDVLLGLEGGSPTFSGFRTRDGVPCFLRRLIARDDEVKKRAKIDPDTGFATQFMYLYQVCMTFKKLRGPYKEGTLQGQWIDFVQTDLEADAIEEQVESDTELRQILGLASYYFSEDFKDVTMDHPSAVPRPGPGATVGCIPRPLRYEPHVVYPQHDAILPYDEWFYPTPYDWIHQARHFKAAIIDGYAMNKSPHAEFLFVPKQWDKARGICKETNEAQFLQQAAAARLRHAIYSHKHLSFLMDFADQGTNRDLAFNSSITREMATLDMSDASNRIFRFVVSRLTHGTPMHEVLMALSTRYIKPPKQAGGKKDRCPIKVRMFAPMGSGLCFPVMSLVHYYLILAILVRRGLPKDVIEKRIYVYGDDIIVPTACAESIMRTLPKFGMKLNRNKSFVRSHFRESCGIHAYNGVDVTPVFIKNILFDSTSEERSPEYGQPNTQYASMLAAEYGFHKRGYMHTAKLLRSYCHRFTKTGYVPRLSGLVGFMRDGGDEDLERLFRMYRYEKRVRWNENLQCCEYRVQRFFRKPINSTMLCDTSALQRYWSLGNAEFDSRDVVDRPYDELIVKWSWETLSSKQ